MSFFQSRMQYNARFNGQESVVVPRWKTATGEYPTISYQQLFRIVTSDTQLYSDIIFIRNRCLSRGFHIETNPKAPNYVAEEARAFLEDWLKYVRYGDQRNEKGFTAIAENIVDEKLWAGTSLLEMIPGPEHIESFAQVQISSIWKVHRAEDGSLLTIWQIPSWNPKALTPSKYLMFINNQFNREPFGYGLIHPLATPKVGFNGELIQPTVYRWWQVQDDAAKKAHRYSQPRAVYSMPGIGVLEAKEYAEELKDPEADATIITNTQIDLKMDTPAMRGNFQPEYDLITNQVKSATGNILTEAITGKGFSFASMVKGASLADVLCWSTQSKFCQEVDMMVLDTVLEQNGFDPYVLKPHLAPNIPDEPTEWTIDDLIKAATPSPTTGTALISVDEFRENVKKLGHWTLMPETTKPPTTGDLQPQDNQPEPGNLVTTPGGQLDPAMLTNMKNAQLMRQQMQPVSDRS